MPLKNKGCGGVLSVGLGGADSEVYVNTGWLKNRERNAYPSSNKINLWHATHIVSEQVEMHKVDTRDLHNCLLGDGDSL